MIHNDVMMAMDILRDPAGLDSSHRSSAELIFVSNRKLIGDAIFSRAAQQLGMSYRFHEVSDFINGVVCRGIFSTGSILVVDLPCLAEMEVEAVAELTHSHECRVAFLESATHSICTRLLSAGFTSVIDMRVNEGALSLVLKMSASGQTFLPCVVSDTSIQSNRITGEGSSIPVALCEQFRELGLQSPSSAESLILLHLLDGLPNKEIASRTGKSIATVKMHVLRMSRRYGVQNRVQLAVYVNGILNSRIRKMGGSAA